MSNLIICPVCETENAPDAINCEVCGERLAPLAPGEELKPEENVSAMLAAQAQAVERDPPTVETALPSDLGLDLVPTVPGGGSFDLDADEPYTTPAAPAGPSTPEALYSPLTGRVYPRGSAEYEEGFGPMGEQLVREQPAEATHVTLEDSFAPVPFEPEPAQEADQTFDDLNSEPEAAPESRTAQEPVVAEPRQSAFHISGPNTAVVLPSPGTYAAPATLTLYAQRQPVLTHDIVTDEVLVGRKDIRADIYPDLDLTQWDIESNVSRKHAYIYRQNKNYTLYCVSNGGLQLNNELLDLGDRRSLKDGDVIVIAGVLAMKFKLPA